LQSQKRRQSKRGGRKKLSKAAKLQQETETFKQIEQELLWLCGAKRDGTKTLSKAQIGRLSNAAKKLETGPVWLVMATCAITENIQAS
jgi:hypothetical protein